ncbi:hypothetical protein VNO77_19226 [Canavalia gladiata]|uniref:Uncharacterized protein n=1 Tax=Canavalia gladiata TaxID=3824 RepID=A0AAN9LM98_CANGL
MHGVHVENLTITEYDRCPYSLGMDRVQVVLMLDERHRSLARSKHDVNPASVFIHSAETSHADATIALNLLESLLPIVQNALEFHYEWDSKPPSQLATSSRIGQCAPLCINLYLEPVFSCYVFPIISMCVITSKHTLELRRERVHQMHGGPIKHGNRPRARERTRWTHAVRDDACPFFKSAMEPFARARAEVPWSKIRSSLLSCL